MSKSDLYDYTDAYILVKGTTTVGAGAAVAARVAVEIKNKQYLKMFHRLLTA